MKTLSMLFFIVLAPAIPASAQAVLFNFDNAPIHSSLPIDLTVGGVTAHFSSTGQGFSIQEANALGFTPAGFAGNIIYPNSINLADLHVRFDPALIDFSIMYACQELGCDDAATMRVTAYMSGSLVGTNTKTASNPGTWPVDTLRCSFSQGFDSVVVHYDSRPPTCQDYGTIFVADNMEVTPASAVSVPEPAGELPVAFTLRQNYPNPFNPSTRISYALPAGAAVTMSVYDILGRQVSSLVLGYQEAGWRAVTFEAGSLPSGVYTYRLTAGTQSLVKKMLLMR
jgi:hypothetical protein